MQYFARRARREDTFRIHQLYQLVAKTAGGLARRPEEISMDLIGEIVSRCSAHGLILVLESRETGLLEGVIHADGNEIQDLRHILSHLTFLIHPERQGQGLGKFLFQNFLNTVKKELPHIYRVELRARSSNLAALGLYESLGFIREGLFRARIRDRNGSLEDGIPMVWFNLSIENAKTI